MVSFRGCKALVEAITSLVVTRVVTFCVELAVCSGLRRLALLGNCQLVCSCISGRRLRQRHCVMTCLAVDCGGSLSLAELHRCSSSSKDGARDFLGLPVVCARVEQRGDVDPWWWLGYSMRLQMAGQLRTSS